MDVSFSSYLTLLILVVLSLSIFFKTKTTVYIINIISTVFLILISIISVVDLELFQEWGFRFDATPLMYLNTPKEMTASVASSPYVILISGMVAGFLLSYWLFRKLVLPQFKKASNPTPVQSLVYLLIAGMMIIPIRGGLQLAPMNQSAAFFSNNDFANQAAINVPWNFFWSLNKQLYSRTNPYEFLPHAEAQKLIEDIYQADTSPSKRVLNQPRPNIIVILWESLTSKVLPELGGTYPDVVPELRSLIGEGILFNNFYANGNRSDKGIVAILSGYPAQPKPSIVKIPVKSSKLPVITTPLVEKGYYTGYFHGGELAFANIKSYLIHAGFNTLVGKDAFEKNEMNSKWGAHDHVLLEKALQDISKQPQPFFNVIFTLSSHEPFDIPVVPQFPGDDLESQYKSSLHYTDQAIGHFIRQAKKQSWYENTLIVILSDHGHRLLGENPRYEKDRFHIPMLWLGGALEVKDSVVTKTFSQTDLPKTILNQLNIDGAPFRWSRDILNQSTESIAHYIYNEGIGYVKDDEYLVYDVPSDQVLVSSGPIGKNHIERARAHLQVTYQDYLDK
jgi:phosphoglycerol transferase MdoB-like AlkP superfamily enzyme